MNGKKKILSDVALICTLYNERSGIEAFVRSLYGMDVWPAEIVFVDGGSTDGTIDLLKKLVKELFCEIDVHVIVDPTCNINYTPGPVAKGRNIAIAASNKSNIAVTDAGCEVDPLWLKEITAPLQDATIDMVGGRFEPKPTMYFEECQSLLTVENASYLNKNTFLPSSRSVAFRKRIWEQVGGYPEKGLAAEDTLFDIKVRALTDRIVAEPGALVYWRMRPNVFVFAKLIYRYGFGDGFCHILIVNALRNLSKIVAGILLLFCGFFINHFFFVIALLYYWWLPFTRCLQHAFKMKNITKYPVVSFLKEIADVAYFVGYVHGSLTSKHPKFHKINDHAD